MSSLVDFIKNIDFKPAVERLKLETHPVLSADLDSIFSSFSSGEYGACLKRSEVVLDYIWEKLNTGHWQSVSDRWRHAYYCVSYVKACCWVMIDDSSGIGEAIRWCDMGILLGVRPSVWSWKLTVLASSLHKLHRASNTGMTEHVLHLLVLSQLPVFKTYMYSSIFTHFIGGRMRPRNPLFLTESPFWQS